MPWLDKDKRKDYERKWYLRNRTKRLAAVKANRARARKLATEFITAYKSERGCDKCGESDPVVLDFHHRTDDKEFEIGWSISAGFSLTKIKAEISKCDVMCANCHRRHHARLAGSKGTAPHS